MFNRNQSVIDKSKRADAFRSAVRCGRFDLVNNDLSFALFCYERLVNVRGRAQ